MTTAAGGEHPRFLSRRVVPVVVGGWLIVLTILAAATSGSPIFKSSEQSKRTPLPTATTVTSTPPAPPAPTGQGTSSTWGTTALAVLGVVLIVLLAAFVITLLVLAIWSLLTALRRRNRHRTSADETGLAAAAAAAAVARALPDLQRAVIAGSPRAGIIAAWIRLEQLAVDSGVSLRRSETPAELTIRVLDGLEVPGRWVLRLADLYREARFSDHPMTERDRAEAGTCLAQIAGSGSDLSDETVTT